MALVKGKANQNTKIPAGKAKPGAADCGKLTALLESGGATDRRHAAREMLHCPNAAGALVTRLKREGEVPVREAMGHIQFQDVMRQRMEHVQRALEQMRDHLMQLSDTTNRPGRDSQFQTTFKSMLEAHLSEYKMASQTITHLAVAGGVADSDHSHPAIELF